MSQRSDARDMRLVLGIRSETAEASVILNDVSADNAQDRIDWTAGRQLSDSLLGKIEELLKRNQKDWKDLSGIIVYEGPGSFTGLRIGITVANTAAFILNIPIAGATGENWLEEGINKLGSPHFVDIVMPEYGGVPNITKPKK